MTIFSNDGLIFSNDRLLELFHNTRNNPKKVKCISDNPKMFGFGEELKSGDIVIIDGTIHAHFGFAVSVPEQCAFYDYTAFEPCDDFFNTEE